MKVGLTRSQRYLRLAILAVALLLLIRPQPVQAGKADSSSLTELVRRAVANYKAREAQRDNYTYLAHITRTDFDRRGKSKGHTTGTYEIMFLEGAPYRRAITFNGKPLSPEQEQREQALLEAEAKMRKAERENQGASFSFESSSFESSSFRSSSFRSSSLRSTWGAPLDVPFEQLPDEFNLHWRGKQRLDDREVQMIEAFPLSKNDDGGLSPGQEYAQHFKLKLWIDAEDAQLVKVEAEIFKGTVVLHPQVASFTHPDFQVSGIGESQIEFARGTITSTEWTKVNDEAWLPKWSYSKTGKGTLVNLSRTSTNLVILPVEYTSTFSDYKKFRVNSHIEAK